MPENPEREYFSGQVFNSRNDPFTLPLHDASRAEAEHWAGRVTADGTVVGPREDRSYSGGAAVVVRTQGPFQSCLNLIRPLSAPPTPQADLFCGAGEVQRWDPMASAGQRLRDRA